MYGGCSRRDVVAPPARPKRVERRLHAPMLACSWRSATTCAASPTPRSFTPLPNEELSAVIPTEPAGGRRVYLCAYTSGEAKTWLALDDDGASVTDRRLLRDAVSIAACASWPRRPPGAGTSPSSVRSFRRCGSGCARRARRGRAGGRALERVVGGEVRVASPALPRGDRPGDAPSRGRAGRERRLPLSGGDEAGRSNHRRARRRYREPLQGSSSTRCFSPDTDTPFAGRSTGFPGPCGSRSTGSRHSGSLPPWYSCSSPRSRSRTASRPRRWSRRCTAPFPARAAWARPPTG